MLAVYNEFNKLQHEDVDLDKFSSIYNQICI